MRRPPLPDLWGGIECTRNRVGDRYLDQLDLSGHDARISDLDLVASLGVVALRYPVLWERVAPDGLDRADWSWTDERLQRLRSLGVRPIVGLVHHGSGPSHTSLVDPSFPERLAEYAAAVASRYPWVRAYTPVNEPLTTARFSGLYGHWYPHLRDDGAFLRALVTQCRAVAVAMDAIRGVRPDAELVQTEDLGKTFGTPALAYQVELENERRWLTFDLLCGRLDERHPLWEYVTSAGITPDELAWFQEHPCPPDLVGVNHYLSSERFIDERLDRYPADSHGGNGRHEYADVLAARVLEAGPAGPERLLREAWDRYGIPIAVTEAHNGSTREEQVRWLAEVWSAAVSLANAGVDLRAVTVWSVLGAFGWATLVTEEGGRYEPGVFDLRAPQPRPTLLAEACRSIARTGSYDHPVLDTPGWWRRPDRFWYGFAPGSGEPAPHGMTPPPPPRRARPLVVTGATGTLGRAFARACGARGLEHVLTSRQEIEIAEPASVAAALDEIRPWAVINTTGYVRVDDAETDPDACFRSNRDAPAIMASACAERGIPLLTFSSDLVFDGRVDRPYVESDPASPLSVYGASKANGERAVLDALESALVVRTSAFFGPWDPYNFPTTVLADLTAGREVRAADDAVVSPTYVPDLVHAALDLFLDRESGIWHLANDGAVTWAELARVVAALAGLDPDVVTGVPTAELGLAAERPRWSVLGSERGWIMPPLEDALARYVVERERVGPEVPSGAA